MGVAPQGSGAGALFLVVGIAIGVCLLMLYAAGWALKAFVF